MPMTTMLAAAEALFQEALSLSNKPPEPLLLPPKIKVPGPLLVRPAPEEELMLPVGLPTDPTVRKADAVFTVKKSVPFTFVRWSAPVIGVTRAVPAAVPSLEVLS